MADDWETAELEPKRVLARPAPPLGAAPVHGGGGGTPDPPPTTSGPPPQLAQPTPLGVSQDGAAPRQPILLARRPAPSAQPAPHPAPHIQPAPHTHSAPHTQPAQSPPVPPDDEDEWFRGAPASNRQIWDSANRAPPVLMSAPSAPPPKLQILKRDPAPRPASGSSSGTATPKTLAQREEEYRLARERIFGKDGVPSSSASATSTTSAGSVPSGPPSDRGEERRSARGGKRSGGSTPRTPSGRSTPAADELSRAVAQLSLDRRPAAGPVGPVPAPLGDFDRGFDKLDARRGYHSYNSAGYQSYQSYQSYQAPTGYRYSAYEAQTFGPRYATPPAPPPQGYVPRPANPSYPAQQYAQQPYPQQYSQYVPAPHAPSPHSQLPPQQPLPPTYAAPQAAPSPYGYSGSPAPPMSAPQRPSPPPSVPPIQQPRGGGVLRQPRGPGQGGFGRQ